SEHAATRSLSSSAWHKRVSHRLVQQCTTTQALRSRAQALRLSTPRTVAAPPQRERRRANGPPPAPGGPSMTAPRADVCCVAALRGSVERSLSGLRVDDDRSGEFLPTNDFPDHVFV